MCDPKELVSDPLKPIPSPIKFFQMDVIVDKKECSLLVRSDSFDRGQSQTEEPEYNEVVTPLFRLVPGRSAKSYGISCARMAGMPEGVLARASAVSCALESGARVPLPAFTGGAAGSFNRMFEIMLKQAFCADTIMSVDDWRTANAAQLRVLLEFLVSAAS